MPFQQYDDERSCSEEDEEPLIVHQQPFYRGPQIVLQRERKRLEIVDPSTRQSLLEGEQHDNRGSSSSSSTASNSRPTFAQMVSSHATSQQPTKPPQTSSTSAKEMQERFLSNHKKNSTKTKAEKKAERKRLKKEETERKRIQKLALEGMLCDPPRGAASEEAVLVPLRLNVPQRQTGFHTPYSQPPQQAPPFLPPHPSPPSQPPFHPHHTPPQPHAAVQHASDWPLEKINHATNTIWTKYLADHGYVTPDIVEAEVKALLGPL